MWAVIKCDHKKLGILKEDLKKKLNEDVIFYNPKLLVEKFKFNKLKKKEYNLLGDYIFCFNKNFQKESTIKSLKFVKGLKNILYGFAGSQKEIVNFISRCKTAENKDGYLSQDFFDLQINSNYKFSTGPLLYDFQNYKFTKK